MNALTKLEELRRPHVRFAMAADSGSLFHRIRYVLDLHPPQFQRSPLSTVLSIGVVALCLFQAVTQSWLLSAHAMNQSVGIFEHSFQIGREVEGNEIDYNPFENYMDANTEKWILIESRSSDITDPLYVG